MMLTANHHVLLHNAAGILHKSPVLAGHKLLCGTCRGLHTVSIGGRRNPASTLWLATCSGHPWRLACCGRQLLAWIWSEVHDCQHLACCNMSALWTHDFVGKTDFYIRPGRNWLAWKPMKFWTDAVSVYCLQRMHTAWQWCWWQAVQRLTGCNGGRRQVEVAAMEERLQVPQSSRFPLYRQLMWHAAAFYSECLEADLPVGELCHPCAWLIDIWLIDIS